MRLIVLQALNQGDHLLTFELFPLNGCGSLRTQSITVSTCTRKWRLVVRPNHHFIGAELFSQALNIAGRKRFVMLSCVIALQIVTQNT